MDRASTATAPRLPVAGHPLRSPGVHGQSRDVPVPGQGASTHARVSDHTGSSGRSRERARLFRLPLINGVGIRNEFPWLNGWPMRSPTDASPASSPMSAHGSEPRGKLDRKPAVARSGIAHRKTSAAGSDRSALIWRNAGLLARRFSSRAAGAAPACASAGGCSSLRRRRRAACLRPPLFLAVLNSTSNRLVDSSQCVVRKPCYIHSDYLGG